MGPQEKSDEQQHANEESQQHGDAADRGHSGEGAASALRHMISQGDRHRHQGREADDAAGLSQ